MQKKHNPLAVKPAHLYVNPLIRHLDSFQTESHPLQDAILKIMAPSHASLKLVVDPTCWWVRLLRMRSRIVAWQVQNTEKGKGQLEDTH